MPSAKSCAGQNVQVCSEDGTEFSTEQTCSGSSTCQNGACAESACVPGSQFCKDGAVWTCDSGGVSNLSQACEGGEHCQEADDTARCSDAVCTAGLAVCDGNVATTCEEDGSGPKPGGSDCGTQSCFDGACHDALCTVGALVCKDGDVYLCDGGAGQMSLREDCAAGSVCDGENSACAPKVCEAGSISCDGTRAIKCNAYGSAWDPAATDCAQSNQICVAGACQKQVCAPSGRFCQGNAVYECDALGVTTSIVQACPQDFHCTPYAGGAYASCDYNQCRAGEVWCDGNTLRTCGADGNFLAVGTDCGDKNFCGEGRCQPRVCEPSTFFCKGADVLSCDWQGGHADLLTSCPRDTACKVALGNYACVPLPCLAGETACLGNKVGTCAADGQSLSKVTDDCTATAAICGPDAKCAKIALDALGIGEDAITVWTNNVIGDVVQVSSARKLTEMQARLVLPAARELRWVIFEETSIGTYTARQDWLVSNQSGSGLFSSGPINYALKAGKTYLFGVVTSGGNTSIAYLDAAPFAPPSFGTVIGRIESSYFATLNTFPDMGYLYEMKLTTAP